MSTAADSGAHSPNSAVTGSSDATLDPVEPTERRLAQTRRFVRSSRRRTGSRDHGRAPTSEWRCGSGLEITRPPRTSERGPSEPLNLWFASSPVARSCGDSAAATNAGHGPRPSAGTSSPPGSRTAAHGGCERARRGHACFAALTTSAIQRWSGSGSSPSCVGTRDSAVCSPRRAPSRARRPSR